MRGARIDFGVVMPEVVKLMELTDGFLGQQRTFVIDVAASLEGKRQMQDVG
jgi:hypothetical protein